MEPATFFGEVTLPFSRAGNVDYDDFEDDVEIGSKLYFVYPPLQAEMLSPDLLLIACGQPACAFAQKVLTTSPGENSLALTCSRAEKTGGEAGIEARGKSEEVLQVQIGAKGELAVAYVPRQVDAEFVPELTSAIFGLFSRVPSQTVIISAQHVSTYRCSDVDKSATGPFLRALYSKSFQAGRAGVPKRLAIPSIVDGVPASVLEHCESLGAAAVALIGFRPSPGCDRELVNLLQAAFAQMLPSFNTGQLVVDDVDLTEEGSALGNMYI